MRLAIPFAILLLFSCSKEERLSVKRGELEVRYLKANEKEVADSLANFLVMLKVDTTVEQSYQVRFQADTLRVQCIRSTQAPVSEWPEEALVTLTLMQLDLIEYFQRPLIQLEVCDQNFLTEHTLKP